MSIIDDQKEIIKLGTLHSWMFTISLYLIPVAGGWVQSRGTEIDYLYRTKRGEALTVTTGAGSTVGIDLIVLLDD